MRISRLDLKRYGRFTDVSLVFPQAPSDIHVIYGGNEAGKSTSLAAIEDWLFGIDPRSPYDFLHEYSAIRIGGMLEQVGNLFEVLRRKGNKDTLLTPDGTPLPAGDRALTPFLEGTTREFFTRMMSLNHERLRKGGQEIIDARDEVGQMLFAAGTGLSGLREHLATFELKADQLWAPRRAAHRAYYVVADALDAAEKAQRDHTLTATEWYKLKRAFDDAQAAYEALNTDVESRSAEQRKLSRTRRVAHRIKRLTEIEQEISSLGPPILLPPDAEAQLAQALTNQSSAQSRLDELAGQLKRLSAERVALRCDEAVLQHTDEIDRLHRQRIEVEKEKIDLPKRQTERAAKERELRGKAEELGWGSMAADIIIARIPHRASVSTARTLLNQRGATLSARDNAQRTSREAKDQLRALRDEQGAVEGVLDVSSLATALATARKLGDVGARLETLEREVRECETSITKRLKGLHPPTSEQVLTDTPVPPHTSVETHRNTFLHHEERVRACRERLAAAERELAQQSQAYERRAHENDAIAPDALKRVREARETGWQLVRRRYIESQEIAAEELAQFVGDSANLPAAYEQRVEGADRLADRRFENAQAAGEIAFLSRQIEDRKAVLATLQQERQELEAQRSELETAWRALWSGVPFEPLTPDHMLEWLQARAEILGLIERREAARNQLSEWRQKDTGARSAVLGQMEALGENGQDLGESPLSVVIEQGTAVQRRQEALASEQRALEKRIQEGMADVERKNARLEEAEGEWATWQEGWDEALNALGLASQVLPEVASEQIETLETMRTLAGDIDQWRERIGKIEQDIERFTTAIGRLGALVDLRPTPEETVVEIERRLAEAKRVQAQRGEKDRAIDGLVKRIKDCEASRDAARQTLENLQTLAGVTDTDHLKEAIQRTHRRTQLQTERAGIEKALTIEGDGLTLSQLHQECAEANLDQIAAREETLRAALKELQDQLTAATEKRLEARKAFEAAGGADAAAQAAAERQEALAAMRNVTARYVHLRTSALLLRWAIERYRRERQAPLLKRAGRIFGELTSGSFTALQVEYDSEDRPRLTGVRPDRVSVGTSGMSDGTADQLYLALRLASVEEYLERAQALPFVADDLLVNFDDERAAAALRVLAELGRKTQVLFFTHHRHLVEMAREVLGEGVNVTTLVEEERVAAA